MDTLSSPATARLLLTDNTLDGDGTVTPMIRLLGLDHIVFHNHIMDAVTAGIELSDPSSVDLPTSATITGNTFEDLSVGVRLGDSAPNDNDGETVTAVIGGSPAQGNVFINSGGTLGDGSYLVELIGIPTPISAENNNWGLCTVGEIEQEIFHNPDDSDLGTVDFVPFIATNCPTATTTPTATPIQTATPTPSPSPTATPRYWGDIDCSGLLAALDALKLMLGFLELSYDKPLTCPVVGDGVVVTSADQRTWGDIDCSGAVNATDAVYVLASLADAPKTPVSGCPAVGDTITLAAG